VGWWMVEISVRDSPGRGLAAGGGGLLVVVVVVLLLLLPRRTRFQLRVTVRAVVCRSAMS
jgi:hypothetical protein